MQAYADEAAAERRAEAQLAAQRDSLEAHSLKYNHPAQIMLLSSGRYALFGPFKNGEGIELFAIGDWASLEHHVREYRATVDTALERGQRLRTPATEARAKASYDALFGDDT